MVGANRDAIKMNKEFYYADTIKKLEKGVFTPDELSFFASGIVQKTLQKG